VDKKHLEHWQALRSDSPRRGASGPAGLLMTLPRISILRSILLNHYYHHRGQLSVYLQMLGVPLRSIYGPSADENPLTA
jgi:uncharacterized damage-inducible protein DinB